MNVPKRHHYIPQFLLRQFVGPDGKLHVWQKASGRSWTTIPENTFVEQHLYRHQEQHGDDVSLEREYAELEGNASRIVCGWLASMELDTVPSASSQDRVYWDEFYYQQMKRVPQVLSSLLAERTLTERMSDVVPRLEEKLGRKLDDGELSYLNSPEFLSTAENGVFIRAMRDPGSVVRSIFDTMGVQFARASDGGEFALGSRPIVLQALGANGEKMANNCVQWWLPLTPTIAVRLAGESGTISVKDLTPGTLDTVNRLIVAQSDMIVARSPGSLERLAALA